MPTMFTYYSADKDDKNSHTSTTHTGASIDEHSYNQTKGNLKLLNKIWPGCPQKSGTLNFRYFDIQKYSIFFISSDLTLSSETNDTKIIWFSFGSIDFTTISWKIVIYDFFFNLCELFTAGLAVHYFSLCFVCTNQWVFWATMYGSPKSHYPWLKCHENEE